MREEYFYIQSVPLIVTETNTDNPINLAAIKGVIDFSVINPVGSGASFTVLINGINSHTLAPGDPMLMLGGYHNCVRMDSIVINFIGGSTGRAVCYYNKRISVANCLF